MSVLLLILKMFGRSQILTFSFNQEIEIHNKYQNWKLTQEHVEDSMSKSTTVTQVLKVFRDE